MGSVGVHSVSLLPLLHGQGSVLTLGCELVFETHVESGVGVGRESHAGLSNNVFWPAIFIAYRIFNLQKVSDWYELLA